MLKFACIVLAWVLKTIGGGLLSCSFLLDGLGGWAELLHICFYLFFLSVYYVLFTVHKFGFVGGSVQHVVVLLTDRLFIDRGNFLSKHLAVLHLVIGFTNQAAFIISCSIEAILLVLLEIVIVKSASSRFCIIHLLLLLLHSIGFTNCTWQRWRAGSSSIEVAFFVAWSNGNGKLRYLRFSYHLVFWNRIGHWVFVFEEKLLLRKSLLRGWICLVYKAYVVFILNGATCESI